MSREMDALNDLGKAFAEFKDANDKRLAQIEAKGHADPLIEERVNKANAEIDKLQAKLDAEQKAAQNRMDDIEAAMDRPRGGGIVADARHVEARQFFALVSGRKIEDVEPDIEAYNAYHNAFNAYLRRGNSLGMDVQNALSVGSDPDGGYWVMPSMAGRIAELVYETSPMRRYAAVQGIGTDSLQGFNDLAEATAGGWVEETGARPATSTPGIGKWEIFAREQYCSPKATQKLLDDAMIDVEGWLSRKIADVMARTENTAFVSGDGAGKPRGFLTYAAGTPSSSTWDVIAQTNSGASGAFAASSPGDVFHTLIGATKDAYLPNAMWFMNRTTLAAARKLKDGDGTYLWEKNFQVDQPFTLLGYPVARLEDMPALAANSLSIAFGDMRQCYQIVDRFGLRVLRDPYTAKPYVVFYTTVRTGGDVVNFEAIQLIKFAS